VEIHHGDELVDGTRDVGGFRVACCVPRDFTSVTSWFFFEHSFVFMCIFLSVNRVV
jgi:hypothetical protein